MATNPFDDSSEKNPFEDEAEPLTKVSPGGFTGAAQQVGRGALEAIPFAGERLAESAKLPQPTTFTERLTRRAARNLPYALAAAPLTGGIPAALGYVGSVGLGQLAEEVGVPEAYQPVAEMVGGGAPQVARSVAGKTLGYIEKPLEELASKAKSLQYEVGPGARAAQGMKYGTGETPEAAARNLNKFTQQATSRAGNPTSNMNQAWFDATKQALDQESSRLFSGKTFRSTPEFQKEMTDIVNKLDGAFGQQGNIARTIIEKNIGGQRPSGQLLSPKFKAEDLRSAIVEVNQALGSAKGSTAGLLHDLKDSLENLAKKNLPTDLAKQYDSWRSKYNAFATLRDLYQLEGRGGVTAAGQVNPQKLLDVTVNRTGGNASRNPLFKDLAELGDIMKVKTMPRQGLTAATLGEITENPLSKALQLSMQPRLPSRAGGLAATAQTLSPLQEYTQFKGER